MTRTAPARATLDITITLPWPPRALSPNAGNATGWAHRKARKEYRELAGWEWRTHMRFVHLPEHVVADVTFTYTRERRWDIDNHIAMLKPVWDGAKDAGVIVDDNHAVFRIGEVRFERGAERGVTVTLKEGP